MTDKKRQELEREYDREMLKSTIISIFAAVIAFKKKRGKYSYKRLADDLGKDKSAVSRWFSEDPNLELHTVSDIANALDIELRIEAVDRETQTVFNPHEVEEHVVVKVDFASSYSSQRPNTPLSSQTGFQVMAV